jgi:endonuclease/exonuclease/phosphatase family metal-dependent hydrolase
MTHPAPPTVSIASLNLRFGITPGRERPYDVTAAIASLDADVVALQEVWRPRGGAAPHEVAARALGYEVVELELGRAHNKTAPGPVRAAEGLHDTWWGVAVLARRPVRACGSLRFTPIAFDAAKRAALVASVAVDGRSLTVITPHLTYRLWGSLRHLRELAAAVEPLPRPAVVLGDFNMWGPVVGTVLRGWQRPVRGRTWPARLPHSQIDHVLVSPDLQVLEAAVLAPVGSDHLPVRVVVECATACGAP